MIYVGLSTPKKFKLASWLIQKITKSEASHFYSRRYSNYWEHEFVYDSSIRGVGSGSWEKFQDKNRIIKEGVLNLNEKQEKLFVKAFLNYQDTPYDFLAVFGLLIVYIFRLFGKHIQNPLGNDDKLLYCNEFISMAVGKATGEMFMHPEMKSPEEFFQLLKDSGHVK